MDAFVYARMVHLEATVQRLRVRLQQAEALLEELSNRVPTQAPSDNDLYEAERAELRPVEPTLNELDREYDRHRARSAPYRPALNGTDLEDIYKRLGKEILENNKSDAEDAEDDEDSNWPPYGGG